MFNLCWDDKPGKEIILNYMPWGRGRETIWWYLIYISLATTHSRVVYYILFVLLSSLPLTWDRGNNNNNAIPPSLWSPLSLWSCDRVDSGEWTVPTAEIKNWCKKVSGRTRRDISQSAVRGEWWVVGPLAGRMLIWRWRLGLWWWRLTSGGGNYPTRIWHISHENFLGRRLDAKKGRLWVISNFYIWSSWA